VRPQLTFSQGKYADAHKHFGDALARLAAADPAAPAAVDLRVAIAATHIKRAEWALAGNALERALELDACCAAAHVALAAIRLLMPERLSVAMGVKHLREAHRLDPASAPVCAALASCQLLAGNYSAAESLASDAVRATDAVQHCRGMSVWHPGRCAA
jgi:Flp pilus assembly protein TadD